MFPLSPVKEFHFFSRLLLPLTFLFDTSSTTFSPHMSVSFLPVNPSSSSHSFSYPQILISHRRRFYRSYYVPPPFWTLTPLSVSGLIPRTSGSLINVKIKYSFILSNSPVSSLDSVESGKNWETISSPWHNPWHIKYRNSNFFRISTDYVFNPPIPSLPLPWKSPFPPVFASTLSCTLWKKKGLCLW